MKALNLIEGAAYGPEAVKAMTTAFDEAWKVVAGNFDSDTTEAARVRLAKALLSVAWEESRDVEALKLGALQAMAFSYRAVPFDLSKRATAGNRDVLRDRR